MFPWHPPENSEEEWEQKLRHWQWHQRQSLGGPSMGSVLKLRNILPSYPLSLKNSWIYTNFAFLCKIWLCGSSLILLSVVCWPDMPTWFINTQFLTGMEQKRGSSLSLPFFNYWLLNWESFCLYLLIQPPYIHQLSRCPTEFCGMW